ncbi:hypothetical protein BSL78_04628 [Apostichopus japonicus]|uniref:Uncharacterized protein n=1 Tax=Stichopus japonicus TaxID=307972 RepID=A0A2G8LDV6_STIJA|nr:hypothetical protein BSL78_04628 [Apostichopus japonicus]
MRNPPEDSGIVKRFSYKESNSSSSDGQNSFQTSYNPTDSASKSKSLLGNSDMDVIWSVRNDGTAARKDMLTALSPPPMKGFYSRYTSQDPRFKSLLDSREKGSKYGQSGGQSQYTYSQKKSSYSYSQERGNQQRYSEPSSTFSRQQPPPNYDSEEVFTTRM